MHGHTILLYDGHQCSQSCKTVGLRGDGLEQGDTQMTEVEAEQESAAGPEALAAAENAWAEQGRAGRGRGDRMPQSMDAMIEEMLDQAYEEGMQVNLHAQSVLPQRQCCPLLCYSVDGLLWTACWKAWMRGWRKK